ncbi:unnamed protein product [Pylaiella littoralis]
MIQLAKFFLKRLQACLSFAFAEPPHCWEMPVKVSRHEGGVFHGLFSFPLDNPLSSFDTFKTWQMWHLECSAAVLGHGAQDSSWSLCTNNLVNAGSRHVSNSINALFLAVS